MLTRNVGPKLHSRIQLIRKLIGDIIEANRKKGVSTNLGTMITADVRLRAKGPMQLVQDLVEDIRDLNLQQGISNQPDAKLEAAQKAFEAVRAGRDKVAAEALRELINIVESEQREDDRILKDDAEDLTDAARQIINLLAIKRESAVAYTPS